MPTDRSNYYLWTRAQVRREEREREDRGLLEFTPLPCPKCGSHDLTGALGVSGSRFGQQSVVTTCLSYHEEFPPYPTVTN